MMKYSILLSFFSILYFSCCSSENNTETIATEEKELYNILTDYYQTMSNRDWNRYKTFFIDKAILTTIWQENQDSIPKIFTSSITEFIAKTGEGPDSQPIFEEKMIDAKISVKGGLAQAWVKYEAKFGTAEALMEWKGYDLFSFMRFEKEWKIISIAYEAEHE